MAPLFGSFFSPGCSAGYIGSLSLALAIQGCIGRELYCSGTTKALTTADYASCCHLYIQQYVISFLSSSHVSPLSAGVLPPFLPPAHSVCVILLSPSSLAKFCLFRLSTFICLFIHLSDSLFFPPIFLLSFLPDAHSDSVFDLCSFLSLSFSHFLSLPLEAACCVSAS